MTEAIQKQNRDTIIILIYEVVDQDLSTILRMREAQYRLSKDLCKKAPRGCMPWSEYKNMIMERLMSAAGWNELRQLCDTRRVNLQKPVAYLQTLSRGKEIVESFGHKLADKAYVEKAMVDFMPAEVDVTEKAYHAEKKLTDASYTLEAAQVHVKALDWPAFKKLVTSVLINSTRTFHARGKIKRTGEESSAKGPVKQKDKKEGKRKSDRPSSQEKARGKTAGGKARIPPCEKCSKVGLTFQP